ncbi:hypothetical protein BV22DRAFT_1014643 [Leucogyrophana mollusca]|uniref:Uncharacterized protein n=1 Tax=Leucogyrophana mollusca TaxID=85980 RepID=A0ACB8BDB3_9AGAM|nr:hypothetical protein BV22DRAFT_1014643 [Leucogyrophana mollusca]
MRVFDHYKDSVIALRDEIEETCVLNVWPKISRAPQLHLLEEWVAAGNPWRFRQKLRVDPVVYGQIVSILETHPIFHNNSNNPQLPVAIQVAVFLYAE